jgi:hypothetical protein
MISVRRLANLAHVVLVIAGHAAPAKGLRVERLGADNDSFHHCNGVHGESAAMKARI